LSTRKICVNSWLRINGKQVIAIFMQSCFNADMFKNISIIGDGAMATVLAMLLAEKKIPVRVWGYDAAQLRQIEQSRENTRFLPGYKLPDSIGFEPADDRIIAGCDLIVCAVPCQYIRSVFERLKKGAARYRLRSKTSNLCRPDRAR